MDFAWSPAQEELYATILTGVRRIECTPDQPWTRTQWQQCGALGLLGLSVPKAYEGQGYDALTTAHALEAFGYGCKDMGLVFSSAAHLFACSMPIAHFGEEALKRRFLSGLSNGTLVGANAITEESAGSDVYAQKTSAVREGETYILNGCKSYVSNGPLADVLVVYAMTNPAHGYLGLSSFVVEKGTPGLIIGEPFRKMGLTSTLACQITFENCHVPLQHRLGREGQGYQIFRHSMHWERACLFAAYIGLLDAQLEQTLTYTKGRVQFGKPLNKHQAIAHRLADMKLRLESARLLLYHACWLFDQDKDSDLAISLSKLAISEAAVQGGLDAIQIHGSLGFSQEYGIERMLRDAIPSTLFSGTSEMQRDIIASEISL